MTDLERVLSRLAEDPSFAAQLRADPKGALAPYDLSDEDFAQVENEVASQAGPPALASRNVGVGAFFTTLPSGPPWWRRWSLAGAVGAVILVGSGAGFALAGNRNESEALPPVSASAAAASGFEMTAVGYSLCPGSGAEATQTGNFHRGDHVWIIGRDDTSQWVAVRNPSGDRVWVAAGSVTGAGVERLPIAACELPSGSSAGPGGATAGTSESTIATTSASDPKGVDPAIPLTVVTDPVSRPSVPVSPPTVSNSTVPVIPGDHDGPLLQNLAGSPNDIWQHYVAAGGRCVTQTSSLIAAQIADPSGVTGAQLTWTLAGTPGQQGPISMSQSGSTWSATVGPIEWAANAIPASGADIGIRITAVDGAGNTSVATTTLHLHNAEECLG